MAIITEIRRVDMENASTSTTVLDYSINKNGLSIWTYASNDSNRERSPKQNLLFTKEIAKTLYAALGEYLIKD